MRDYILANFVMELTDGAYNYLVVRPTEEFSCMRCDRVATIAEFDVEDSEPSMCCEECWQTYRSYEDEDYRRVKTDDTPEQVADGWVELWTQAGRTWPFENKEEK